MSEFNQNMSIEQILNKMNKSDGNTETIHAGPCFLNYKLHQELLKDQETKHKELIEIQKQYNDKQLFWSRCLAFATWALVVVTIFLIKCEP
jgi:hypothetical protein